MKRQYARELAEGVRVESDFYLGSKEMRSTRTGEAYLVLEFADRTGRIPGVYFRPDSSASTVPTGAIVRVSGRVTKFRGSKRISVDTMTPAPEYDPADMLESSRRDGAEVLREFKEVAATVRDRDLRALLRAVFGDTDFFARFSSCPGARTYHHAYLGGLIEHTIAVARLCAQLAASYERVDRDLLVCAALLHDIGKVDELTYERAVGYTDEGRLLGHVVLSERRVREAASKMRRQPPSQALIRLSHAVLAHHGELEWGSPKRPSTIEALLLHHADNLDAKVDGFLALTNGPSRVEESWTDSSNLFRRPLYAPASLEDAQPVPDVEEAHYLLGA